MKEVETLRRSEISEKVLSKRELLTRIKFWRINFIDEVKKLAIEKRVPQLPSHEDYLKDSMSVERIPRRH